MTEKKIPPSVAEFAVGTLANQILKAQAEIKTWPERKQKEVGELPDPKEWLAEHPLQTCLRENGEQIALSATVSQQAELIRLQSAEIATLKQKSAGVVLPEPDTSMAIGEYRNGCKIGWNHCLREVARLNPPDDPTMVKVPRELLERASNWIDRRTYFKFGEPLTLEDERGSAIEYELRALLTQQEVQ